MSFDPSVSNSVHTPLTEEQIRQKKSRARRNIIFVFCAFAILTLIEIYFINQQTATIADNISILLLFNVIIILLFIMITLIIRNLVKLYNERKSKKFGSKFQTKLIVAFLILALVPSILLFSVANKLFSYSIGNWFSLQVERSLQQSMEVAREYYSHMEAESQHHAKNIEKLITSNELYLQEKRDQLQQLIEIKVEEYELGGVIVYDHQGNVVVSYAHKSMPENYTNLDYADLIRESMGNESISEIQSHTKGNYLVVLVPLAQKTGGQESIWGYILTLSKIPKSTVLKIENIRNTFDDYKKQSFLKLPVTANYYITFLLITLLILFSAIWLGFYMARGITIPIQQLAAGTQRIREGDLDVKITSNSSDEIGLLVDSFNNMTEELRSNRIKIETAHENLKTTNIELDRRRDYIETILTNIGAGVISIDKRTRITTINNAAKRLLDIKDKDVLGLSYKDAFSHAVQEPIRRLIKEMNASQSETLEDQIELRVGEKTLTLLTNIKFIQGDKNKYMGLLIVFEDVTQLIKAQKIAAWQEVAQGIAHEIRNPLTPIQLNAQRLKKKYYEDKKGFAKVFDESIRIITQEVEGMKDLLNEFVRFSRMPPARPRSASIHQIIDDVASLYENHDKPFSIVKIFDLNIRSLHIDPEQFRRVFINLFENALDAFEGDGIIEITTRWNTQDNIVRIEFSDNGMGISNDDRDKLFLPHFTTKKRGTGLGLAIVNRIIIDHNGTIQVRENDPKGTAFVIELPDSTSTSATRPNLKSRQKTFSPF